MAERLRSAGQSENFGSLLNELGKNAIMKEKLIADILATGIKCQTVNYPPKEINVDRLSFDNEHINKEHQHNVTEEEAKEFIKSAVISFTKWNDLFENYYSQ